MDMIIFKSKKNLEDYTNMILDELNKASKENYIKLMNEFNRIAAIYKSVIK